MRKIILLFLLLCGGLLNAQISLSEIQDTVGKGYVPITDYDPALATYIQKYMLLQDYLEDSISWASVPVGLHDAVTLAGSYDYITLSGQVITRNQIDLTTDVTGLLPYASLSGAPTLLSQFTDDLGHIEESTTVTDLANGLDISLSTYDITVSPDFVELTTETTIDGTDYIIIHDATTPNDGKITYANLLADIVSDASLDLYQVLTNGNDAGGLDAMNFAEVEADEFIGDLRGAVLFKAQAGENLSKGEVVYVSGISGNTTIVSKADADDAAKMPAFGVVAVAANSGNPVDIYTFGTLSNLNTSAFTIGDILYVSTTAGQLTATPPTGESALIQNIAKVTRVDNSAGSIKISGAGRTNATPNLNTGRLFVGNASNQAVADGTMYVDIANSRVGIGNVSPLRKLTVDYTGAADGVVFTRTDFGAGSSHYFHGSGGDPQIRLDRNGTVWSLGNDAGIFSIEYSSTLAGTGTGLYMNTTGNVGIGLSNPSQKLEVAGNIYTTNDGSDNRIKTYFSDGTYFDISGYRLESSSTNIQLVPTPANNGLANLSLGISTRQYNFVNTYFDNAARWYVSNSQEMLLNSSGLDLTTVPTENTNDILTWGSGGLISKTTKADIIADAGYWDRTGTTITQANTGDDLNFDSNTLFVDASTDRVGIGTNVPDEEIHIKKNSNVALKIEAENTNAAALNIVAGTTDWAFYADQDLGDELRLTSPSFLNIITFEGSGEVGIGFNNVNPTSTLDILGTSEFSDDANFDSGTLFVDASTNSVGIGTSNPFEELHIKGTASAAVIEGTSVGALVLGDTGGTHNNEFFGVVSDADRLDIRRYTTAVEGTLPVNGLVNIMTFKDDLVGIGTESPDEILEVRNDEPIIKISSADQIEGTGGTEVIGGIEFEGYKNVVYSPSGKILSRQSGNTWSSATQYNAPSDLEFYAQNNTSTDYTDHTIAVPIMTLHGITQNVGIGTREPSKQLTIQSDGNAESLIETTIDALAATTLKNAYAQWRIGVEPFDDGLIFRQQDAGYTVGEALKLETDLDVRVYNNLTVDGIANVTGNITSYADITGDDFFVRQGIVAEGDTDTEIDMNLNDEIEFYAGGRKMFRIDEDAQDVIEFNPDAQNIDFLIDSDNVSEIFKVDASADEVQLNGEVVWSERALGEMYRLAEQSVTNGNTDKIDFATQVYQDGDITTDVTTLDRITVTNAGKYTIHLSALMSNDGTSSDSGRLLIYKNGSQIADSEFSNVQHVGLDSVTKSISGILNLAASDYLEVYLQELSGTGDAEVARVRFTVKREIGY
jgi:hypothetical protein